MSQAELARKLGISREGLRKIEAGGSDIKASTLMKYEAIGADVLYILTGRTPNQQHVYELSRLPQRAIQNARNAESDAIRELRDMHGEAAAVRDVLEPTKVGAPPATPTPDDDRFATIPRFEAELAAGAGRANGDEVAVELLAFRRDWLRQMGVTADKACLLKVRGDSMAPTLQDGDLVLVDRARRDDIRDDRIYAFTEDGEARVKRLLRAGGELLLRSDNPDHPVEHRKGRDMNRLNVLGEVVWSGHELR